MNLDAPQCTPDTVKIFSLLKRHLYVLSRCMMITLLIVLCIGIVTITIISIKNYMLNQQSMLWLRDLWTTGDDDDLLSHFTPTTSVVVVQKGDTLQTILRKQNIPINTIAQIISLKDVRQHAFSLKIGQHIHFHYELQNSLQTHDNDDNSLSQQRILKQIVITLDKTHSVEINYDDESFSANTVTIQLNKFIVKISTKINQSVIPTLKSLGLSTSSVVELTNAYSNQVNFQRNVKHGDAITIIVEKFMTQNDKFSHYGKILYAALKLADKEYVVYRHPKHYNFFSENGTSLQQQKGVLQPPVKSARISSPYGKRRHPSLKYVKMHKGVDYAAAYGTPIYAAGSGTITHLCWKPGYGKLVQIKHNASLSTLYAHVHNFAKNLKVGSVVQQGQVVAYVGNDGQSTGPHVHYEVKLNGKNVDPLSMKATPRVVLSGKQLTQFEQFKHKVKNLSVKLDAVSRIEASHSVW